MSKTQCNCCKRGSVNTSIASRPQSVLSSRGFRSWVTWHFVLPVYLIGLIEKLVWNETDVTRGSGLLLLGLWTGFIISAAAAAVNQFIKALRSLMFNQFSSQQVAEDRIMLRWIFGGREDQSFVEVKCFCPDYLWKTTILNDLYGLNAALII